jgi:hypothetical protein
MADSLRHSNKDGGSGPSVTASGAGIAGRLEDYLTQRDLTAAERRQRLRHAFSHQPAIIQKWLRKAAWRSPFRHMHYVPPAVAVKPAAGGGWVLRRRVVGSPEIVTRPLAGLRDLSDRPATVVATGPSANSYDWSSLAGRRRVIWAVNGAPTMLAACGLGCDFLIVTDHRFARDGTGHIELAVNQGATLVFSYEAAAGFAATRPDLLERAPFHVFEKANAWYGLAALDAARLTAMNAASGHPFVLPEAPKPGVGWSRDPLVGVFAGRTVTFAALQLAVWSGARDIEVIGLDLGGKTRAYDETNPAVSHLEAEKRDFILPSFRCLARALAGGHVRITNLSEISALPRDLVPAVAAPP